jgi:hypothetical protein
MKNQILGIVSALFALFILFGCKPDKIVLEVYTSDILKASTESVVEVPLTATFSIMGEDEDGNLPKASAVAKRYLDMKAEFKMSKGDWGDVMVIKCSVPMGTPEALKTYLAANHRPFALTINDSIVKLVATEHLKTLNQDLGGINMMLDVNMPAKSTIVRFIGDMAEAPEIKAFAVFVDNKPEIVFRKKIARRASFDIDYKGGDASIYSEIAPQFQVKL